MQGERATAPTLPPPTPCTAPPLLGVFGPWTSPQQPLASSPDLASSNVIKSIPWSLKPGDLRILGTHLSRNRLAETRPPGFPSTQGSSWPSLQRFGVMNE